MNTSDFEKAALAKGYHIERITKKNPTTVKSMFGTITVGLQHIKVRWNSIGSCYTLSGRRLPKFDLF